LLYIVDVTEQAKRLKERYTDDLVTANAAYTPTEDCETYEQCQELPTIICQEHAQLATCIEEQEICSNMVQTCTESSEYCTRYNSNDDCLESITKCDLWENICPEDETSTICLEFETSDIPDECLIMELVCDSSEEPDQKCVSDSEGIQQEIDGLEEDIQALDDLLDEMKQLSDSSICLIKRSEQDDNTLDCTSNDQYVENLDKIEILDIFEIQTIISNMQLNYVIASDSIIFDSNVWLYGDWTGDGNDYGNTLVDSYELTIEEEQVDTGYNSYAKSLINVKHTIDYDSVDLTAENLYNSIRGIVCLEFGIGEDESDSIQTTITEFALIDGNATICPPYTEISDKGLSSGLHSELEEATSTGIDADNNELESYSYTYDEGRNEIQTSEEQIYDQSTLAYEDREDQDPKDVTVDEAVLDDVEAEEVDPGTPSESASEDLDIDGESLGDDEPTDEEIEAIELDNEMQSQYETAEDTLENQDSIDEQQLVEADEQEKQIEEAKELAKQTVEEISDKIEETEQNAEGIVDQIEEAEQNAEGEAEQTAEEEAEKTAKEEAEEAEEAEQTEEEVAEEVEEELSEQIEEDESNNTDEDESTMEPVETDDITFEDGEETDQTIVQTPE
jgi:hypothetical protein